MVFIRLMGYALIAVCVMGCFWSRPYIRGEVQFVETVDGGFYGIVSEYGTRYKPLNLPGRFEEDGLRVKFKKKACMTCLGASMWGEAVKLTIIRRSWRGTQPGDSTYEMLEQKYSGADKY